MSKAKLYLILAAALVLSLAFAGVCLDPRAVFHYHRRLRRLPRRPRRAGAEALKDRADADRALFSLPR